MSQHPTVNANQDVTDSVDAPISVLGLETVLAKIKENSIGARAKYAAMYSSWYGGIIRDPALMMVPIDDHVVHRGDGVFEAVKCLDHKIYGLDRHLDRLQISASRIGLELPASVKRIHSICLQTTRAAGLKDALLRLYVSRGPGGFTTNPYECVGAQIYLVITPFVPFSAEKYQTGVTAEVSRLKVKEGFFANVKSCNYLQNVLLKKEAVDQGVDFMLTEDEQGFLAESSTENFAIVSAGGEFWLPPYDRILKGITAVRAQELARGLLKAGLITAIKNQSFSIADVLAAREAMMIGTTLDILPVTTVNKQKIGSGAVGDFAKSLLGLIKEDLKAGPLVVSV